jgi:hypothetical protein
MHSAFMLSDRRLRLWLARGQQQAQPGEKPIGSTKKRRGETA